MDAFSTLILVIHVVTAIMGLGVVTAFPFLGMKSLEEPAHAAILNRMITLMSQRVFIPAAGLQLITGVILIFSLNLSLTANPWLGASIIIYLAVMAVATGVMQPKGRKLIAILEAGDGRSIPAEAVVVMNKLRNFGQVVVLGIVVIAILMVWQPGTT